MRLSLSSQLWPLSRRTGVIAREKQSRYKVQSPVLRVMNSPGLAQSRSVTVNSTSRAKGSNAEMKSAHLIRPNCFCEGLNFAIKRTPDGSQAGRCGNAD